MRRRVCKARSLRYCYALYLTLSLLVVIQSMATNAGETALLTADSGWNLPEGHAQGQLAVETGSLEIRGLGELPFDPLAITTLRADLFMPGHFSVFDVLVHLAETGAIELEYEFDEELQTYVIHSLRGLSGWWYDAHYEGGSFDKTLVRMDQFPVKDGMNIVVYLENPARLDAIHEHFREQVVRRAANEDAVVIPRVTLQSSTATAEFHDIAVTAHDARSDVFQDGVITMIDVLLSLGEQGALTELGFDWREDDGEVSVVDGYYVVLVQSETFAPEITGSCVLTHQIQGETIADFLSPHTHTMSHIHLTADLEVLVSPEAVEWLWICL